MSTTQRGWVMNLHAAALSRLHLVYVQLEQVVVVAKYQNML
jgi:hypothetical protein